MFRSIQMVILGIAICALLCAASQSANAGTIIKLTLGEVSPDVEYDGSTFFTVDDGNAATLGDQDTAIDFTDFLDSIATDITTATASFSMSGLVPDGDAVLFGGSLVLQNFMGGSFSLYDDTNTLLLSGDLTTSALSGPVGQSTGALFTTSFGEVTGGTLQPYIADDTLTLSMAFTSVSTTGGGPGFTVTVTGAFPPFIEVGDLNPFTGDATVNFEAERIPEPASLALLLAGGALIAVGRRRRQCG